ncbi:MAG: imidazole glycerol phosphate synthase subunit HisH [Dehalococcoidia bacterium]
MKPVRAAITDYGLGNLFSVKHACEHAGMEAIITSSSKEILGADVVILPGVGAFGNAMEALNRLDLVSPLKEVAASNRFLFGICLGMQLLMTESYEFGRHAGLGIIEGPVVRFDNPVGPSGKLKIPQVCWNRIFRKGGLAGQDEWADSPLRGIPDGEFMYFVHSFYPKPVHSNVVLSVTRYGQIEFCSSLKYGNTFANQFHPERSGPQGLQIYRNIASLVVDDKEHIDA